MRTHSRAVFWRTGALVITLVGVTQLAWLQHQDALSGRSISTPIGFSQVWSAYRVASVDEPQDWNAEYPQARLEYIEDQSEDAFASGNSRPQALFKQEDDWCSEAEYLDGEWVSRDEIVTLENIRSIFQFQVRSKNRRIWHPCPPLYLT